MRKNYRTRFLGVLLTQLPCGSPYGLAFNLSQQVNGPSRCMNTFVRKNASSELLLKQV